MDDLERTKRMLDIMLTKLINESEEELNTTPGRYPLSRQYLHGRVDALKAARGRSKAILAVIKGGKS